MAKGSLADRLAVAQSSTSTSEELKLIRDMRRRSPKLGMIEFGQATAARVYPRPESCFRVMRKLGSFGEKAT
jgi:hypothetical protein